MRTRRAMSRLIIPERGPPESVTTHFLSRAEVRGPKPITILSGGANGEHLSRVAGWPRAIWCAECNQAGECFTFLAKSTFDTISPRPGMPKLRRLRARAGRFCGISLGETVGPTGSDDLAALATGFPNLILFLSHLDLYAITLAGPLIPLSRLTSLFSFLFCYVLPYYFYIGQTPDGNLESRSRH